MTFLIHILIVLCVSLPHQLGYNLVFGKGKIFHFGPLGASLLAAYGVFLSLPFTHSYFLSFFIGWSLSLLLSALYAWLSLRLEPDGLGVMSIALHLGILSLILNTGNITRGSMGLPNIPRMADLDTQGQFVAVVIGVAIAWILLLWLLEHSAFGRRLAALSEHTWHAAAVGIDRARTHLVAFLILGTGAAITNTLFHQYIRLVHPSDFAFSYFIFMIMVTVAGKPGSVLGVTLSATLLTILREGLRFAPLSPDLLGPVRLILFGLILFVAVYWRRDSLFPQQRTV
ncbi:branched-chain amino acid ABC transporter permease [Candidatus Peregrinibacteria bacterium]|nr:branched-chain amino acid ABC transporter permease [Candidatus Peregrinibacteria bacterium]